MNSLKSSALTSQANQAPKVQSSDLADIANFISPLEQLDRPTPGQKQAIAQIYLEQASLYYLEQNWHKALLACKNALEIAPQTVEVYQVLGDILYRQGKVAEALGIYAKALMINPNCAKVYANLGDLYAEQENWHKALDYYQQAVAIAPDLAQCYLGLARVWEELEDLEQAIECFCRAINLEPEILSSGEYFSFGRELYQQGKLKEASILLIHGIQLNPSAVQELEQLVQILEELEEWQQAVIYYHQLISLPDSQGDDAIANVSYKPIKKLLSGSKLPSEAGIKPIIAKNTQREIPSLPQDLALKLLPKANSGKVKEQIAELAPEVLTPDSALSWNNLGSSYAQKQQWAKAISCYQEALQLDPHFAKSYRNLARVYNKLGDEHQAAICWYKAFSIQPDLVKPEAHFSLAEKLLEYQQQDQAIACLRRTIQLEPRFSAAYLTLGKLLEQQGKSQEAAACYAQIATQTSKQ